MRYPSLTVDLAPRAVWTDTSYSYVHVVKWLSRRNFALIVFPCQLLASSVKTKANRQLTYIAGAQKNCLDVLLAT